MKKRKQKMIDRRTCEACKGAGYINGDRSRICVLCGGTGVIEVDLSEHTGEAQRDD